jgi:hypothetical protein
MSKNKKKDPLQLLTPLESTGLGIAAGVIEVCINQPQLYLKNAAQQGTYFFIGFHTHISSIKSTFNPHIRISIVALYH